VNNPYTVYIVLIVIDCGVPTDITNGSIEVQSTDYRSTIRYSCDYGYILIGLRSRSCQENGLWSGEPPICEGKQMYISR